MGVSALLIKNSQCLSGAKWERYTGSVIELFNPALPVERAVLSTQMFTWNSDPTFPGMLAYTRLDAIQIIPSIEWEGSLVFAWVYIAPRLVIRVLGVWLGVSAVYGIKVDEKLGCRLARRIIGVGGGPARASNFTRPALQWSPLAGIMRGEGGSAFPRNCVYYPLFPIAFLPELSCFHGNFGLFRRLARIVFYSWTICVRFQIVNTV